MESSAKVPYASRRTRKWRNIPVLGAEKRGVGTAAENYSCFNEEREKGVSLRELKPE